MVFRDYDIILLDLPEELRDNRFAYEHIQTEMRECIQAEFESERGCPYYISMLYPDKNHSIAFELFSVQRQRRYNRTVADYTFYYTYFYPSKNFDVFKDF